MLRFPSKCQRRRNPPILLEGGSSGRGVKHNCWRHSSRFILCVHACTQTMCYENTQNCTSFSMAKLNHKFRFNRGTRKLCELRNTHIGHMANRRTEYLVCFACFTKKFTLYNRNIFKPLEICYLLYKHI